MAVKTCYKKIHFFFAIKSLECVNISAHFKPFKRVCEYHFKNGSKGLSSRYLLKLYIVRTQQVLSSISYMKNIFTLAFISFTKFHVFKVKNSITMIEFPNFTLLLKFTPHNKLNFSKRKWGKKETSGFDAVFQSGNTFFLALL